jgi:hypothetical protein
VQADKLKRKDDILGGIDWGHIAFTAAQIPVIIACYNNRMMPI